MESVITRIENGILEKVGSGKIFQQELLRRFQSPYLKECLDIYSRIKKSDDGFLRNMIHQITDIIIGESMDDLPKLQAYLESAKSGFDSAITSFEDLTVKGSIPDSDKQQVLTIFTEVSNFLDKKNSICY